MLRDRSACAPEGCGCCPHERSTCVRLEGRAATSRPRGQEALALGGEVWLPARAQTGRDANTYMRHAFFGAVVWLPQKLRSPMRSFSIPSLFFSSHF